METGLAAEGQPSSQPNILFLLTDDQRFDTLDCAGYPIIKTPVIDDLAAHGVLLNERLSPPRAVRRAGHRSLPDSPSEPMGIPSGRPRLIRSTC